MIELFKVEYFGNFEYGVNGYDGKDGWLIDGRCK